MKAVEELEMRRRKRAFEDFKQKWWWFDAANHQHIHEFSAAWEILRRTRSYQLLSERVRAATRTIDPHSFGVLRAGKATSSLHEMLRRFAVAPAEVRDIVQRWQNMIVNRWTPEKTYLEIDRSATAECLLPDGKVIRIPPVYSGLNRGVPVILPRQVASRGQTALFVELCKVVLVRGQPPEITHLAGWTVPTEMLKTMHRFGMSVHDNVDGEFIAIELPLNRPAQALRALVKSGLDAIEHSGVWKRPADVAHQYSRGPQFIIGSLTPAEAIALFSADEPRNVIERGFRTLIRPERIKEFLPRLREEWIKWESTERARYAPDCSKRTVFGKARAAWNTAENSGKLVRQSTTRPIRPAQDLDNLACADCDVFYGHSHANLPDALPSRLRIDADLNKRISTGLRLMSSVDDVFLSLLNLK